LPSVLTIKNELIYMSDKKNQNVEECCEDEKVKCCSGCSGQKDE